MGKNVVDAKQDRKGNIIAVNSSYTPVETAMKMADRGRIDNAHTVRPKNGTKAHLRTNPADKE